MNCNQHSKLSYIEYGIAKDYRLKIYLNNEVSNENNINLY